MAAIAYNLKKLMKHHRKSGLVGSLAKLPDINTIFTRIQSLFEVFLVSLKMQAQISNKKLSLAITQD